MLEEVAEQGDADRWVQDALASGRRIMGFGHRVYRAEDPRSRILKRTAEELESPYVDVAEIPPPLAPAMFACSRVAGWSAHILEQKQTGRLFRPSAHYVGPAARSLA